MNWLVQTLSLLGAALILGAFVAIQRGRCRSDDRRYLWANLVGATALTLVGLWDQRWGFIILEGVWALVSLGSLIKGARIEVVT